MVGLGNSERGQFWYGLYVVGLRKHFLLSYYVLSYNYSVC